MHEVVAVVNKTLQTEILSLKKKLADEGRLVASNGYGSDEELARVWELRTLEEYFKRGMRGIAHIRKRDSHDRRKRVGVISFLNDWMRLKCQDIETGEILLLDLEEWEIEDIPVSRRLRSATGTVQVARTKVEEARDEMLQHDKEFLVVCEEFRKKFLRFAQQRNRIGRKLELATRLADDAARTVREAQSECVKVLERMCQGERRDAP